jgi:hypothetical protein
MVATAIGPWGSVRGAHSLASRVPVPVRPTQVTQADYSRPPPPPEASKNAPPDTKSIVVMGDSMADWLAYGLEEAFAEAPEISVTRKARP